MENQRIKSFVFAKRDVLVPETSPRTKAARAFWEAYFEPPKFPEFKTKQKPEDDKDQGGVKEEEEVDDEDEMVDYYSMEVEDVETDEAEVQNEDDEVKKEYSLSSSATPDFAI